MKCQEPVRRETNEGSSIEFFLIYRVLDAAARAKWLHNLIHKASVNKLE